MYYIRGVASSSTSGMEKKKMGRGTFIKNAALASSAFYIVPRFVLGGKGYVAPSDKLYIAAVGCGGEGGNDIRHYATSPKKNAVIALLCDVDERMAATRSCTGWTEELLQTGR